MSFSDRFKSQASSESEDEELEFFEFTDSDEKILRSENRELKEKLGQQKQENENLRQENEKLEEMLREREDQSSELAAAQKELKSLRHKQKIMEKMQREKANKEQNLLPAKAHSGYGVLRTSAMSVQSRYCHNIPNMYETTLTTPFRTDDITAWEAYRMITFLFPGVTNCTDPKCLFTRLGIDVACFEASRLDDALVRAREDVKMEENRNNIAFGFRVSSSEKGYYIMSFKHSKGLLHPIPEEFSPPRPRKNNR